MSTRAPNQGPDEGGLDDPATESICPRCGSPRYRSPFGVACPRCLIGSADEIAANRVDPSDLAEGTSEDSARRFDHFEIALRTDGSWWELERDAIGPIYRAVDLETLSPVALRIVDAAASVGSPDAIFQSAMRVARLRHANVARLIHFGAAIDGRNVIVSESPDGERFSELVRRRGPAPVPLVLEVAAQVAQALIAADEHGLRHGNLCPASLTLRVSRDAGRAHVMVRDFGVAEWHGQFDREYASPEVLAGENADARADFFSLGATLYFLLSGIVPRVDTAIGRVHFTPLRNLGLSEEVLTGLRRLLAASAAGRPRDAVALAEAIESMRKRRKSAGDSMTKPKPSASRWRDWFGGKGG